MSIKNPFESDENLQLWLEKDRSYNFSKQNSLLNYKNKSQKSTSLANKLNQFYLNFVHFTTKNAIVATGIMLLAVSGCAAFAAEISLPKESEFKPSNIVKNIAEPKTNFKQEMNQKTKEEIKQEIPQKPLNTEPPKNKIDTKTETLNKPSDLNIQPKTDSPLILEAEKPKILLQPKNNEVIEMGFNGTGYCKNTSNFAEFQLEGSENIASMVVNYNLNSVDLENILSGKQPAPKDLSSLINTSFNYYCKQYKIELLREIPNVNYSGVDSVKAYYVAKSFESHGFPAVLVLAKKDKTYLILSDRVDFNSGNQIAEKCFVNKENFDEKCYYQEMLNPELIQKVEFKVKELTKNFELK